MNMALLSLDVALFFRKEYILHDILDTRSIMIRTDDRKALTFSYNIQCALKNKGQHLKNRKKVDRC